MDNDDKNFTLHNCERALKKKKRNGQMVVFKNALKKREREKEEGSSGMKLNRYPQKQTIIRWTRIFKSRSENGSDNYS